VAGLNKLFQHFFQKSCGMAVISFLISRSHLAYGQFMLGRVFRIYPVYLVCLAFGLVTALFIAPFVLQTAMWQNTVYFEWNRAVASSESSATGSHIFWHLTLLNGLIPKCLLNNSTGTFLPPAWSITLEWQFYLIAPLLARFVRSGTGLLFLAGLACLGVRFGYIWQNPHNAFLLVQLPLFIIGIGSYHFYEYFAKSSHRRSSIFTVPIAALIATGILAQWHTVALCVWALVFGCIFVEGNDLFSRCLSYLRAVLLNRWVQQLGHISYPIYLVHWPLIIGLLAALLHFRPQVSSHHAVLILLFVGLPLILISARILHTRVERPFMKFGKRLVKPHAKRMSRSG
jgi:peptidoglycan/LPS O-acetylase OafA/YrhL